MFPSLWPCWGARRQSRRSHLSCGGSMPLPGIPWVVSRALFLWIAGLWEHRFVPRKKMLHSNLYSAVPESSLPPCPSTFYTFSLLCFSHSTSQGYTVLFVCLSSQCFSCWAVSSRRAEILFYSLLWPQHSEYLSNKYELNERLPSSGLQGLQASCHSIGP